MATHHVLRLPTHRQHGRLSRRSPTAGTEMGADGPFRAQRSEVPRPTERDPEGSAARACVPGASHLPLLPDKRHAGD